MIIVVLAGKLLGLFLLTAVVMAAFIGTLDTAVFSNIVLGAIALLSPIVLKKIPAHDGRMVLVCIGFSLLLSLIGVFVSGGFQLDWHNVAQVGLATAAFMGLQQTFYATLRDSLKLDQ